MDKRKELGEKMPETAAFLDGLADVFGAGAVWTQVEKGLAGEPTFFARENGMQAGVRDTGSVSEVWLDEKGLSRSGPAPWIVDARKLAKRLGQEIKPADPRIWLDDEREAEQLRDMIAMAKRRGK